MVNAKIRIKENQGLSIIDDGHRKLIDIINKATDAKEQSYNPEETKELIGEMLEYSDKHFSMEEAYMIKFNFPEYQLHRKEHLDFIDKTLMCYNKLIKGNYQIVNELLEYLERWLVNHIQGTDRQYIECFNKNGLQ